MLEFIILALLTGPLLASGGEIADYFYQHAGQSTNVASPVRASVSASGGSQPLLPANRGITEIGIERSEAAWRGPVYTFVARRDGTFWYRGDKNVERIGEFSGTIDVWQFRELSRFLKDSGYMGLKDEYRAQGTDLGVTFTSVVLDGQRKVIRDYGNAGPSVLWAIEELVDDLMAKAHWTAGLPKAPRPALPRVTQYDRDPVLRAAYLASYKKGYVDAWQRKEKLPLFGPTNDADKARVLGYSEGMVAGRAALAEWFGTNNPAGGPTNSTSSKR